MSDVCSECGDRDATFMVEVDGEDAAMCDPCTAWAADARARLVERHGVALRASHPPTNRITRLGP